jgi:putative ABC transport system permease protein
MPFFETIRQDLAFAWRNLRRTPGFTATVVATLALGIGANTAIFSAVNTLLLRPLPFSDPDRLMKLTMIAPAREGGHGPEDMVWSFPKYAAMKAGQTSFSDLAIYASFPYTLLNDGGAERVQTELVNRGYLSTLGIAPAIGRNISAEEDAHPDGPKVVMISGSLWRRSFNATPDVLNRTVTLDGEPYNVIGVLPDNFRGVSGAADLLVPIMTLDAESLNEAEAYSYSVIGRLRPGVTPGAARAEVEGLGVRINQRFPPEIASEQWGSTARPLDGTRVDPFVRQSLLVLLGATLLVLLIACANVANLFLVRGESRRREMAVRLAIGAGRGRLVRQLLSESLLLSVVGSASGLVVAWAAVRYLSTLDNAAAIQSTHSDVVGAVNFASIHLDRAALAFTLLVALATGLIFGLWPAVRATRTSVGEVLKEGKVHATGRSRLAFSSRSLLSVMEIALALVLLSGAGLMIRSLGKLLSVDQGFVADGLLTLRLNSADGVPRDSLPGFFDQLLLDLGALPGVSGAALTDCAPLGGGCSGTIMALHDRPEGEASSRRGVGVHWVTPEWFAVAGVPLVRGRGFARGDRVGAEKVVIVNQTAARTFWPGEDPIGKPVSVGQGGFWPDTAYVVGVVGDVRYGQVQDRPAPEAYLSYFQSPRGRMMVFLKTRGDPVQLAGPARAAIRRLSPGSPVYAVRTFRSLVEDGLGYVRMSTTLLTLFAGLALGLATLGAYGVMAYMVQDRQKELGIRVALGATRAMMVRLVVGQGARLGLIGGGLGLAAALLLTGLLRSQLYGVEPNDPSTLLWIGLVLALAVVIACGIPAWRAARVDPMGALRSE